MIPMASLSKQVYAQTGTLIRGVTCFAGYVQFALQFLKLYLVAAHQLFRELYLRFTAWSVKDSCPEYYEASGAVAVISGGMHGIGFETTRQLLAIGVNVIVGSPISDLHRLAELSMEFPSSKVTWFHLDLRSMKSVKDFAQRVLDCGAPIDLLICNAGVMFVPYQETEDGFETHMSVNYLGHCLLTCLLMPRLRRRIVNVTSCVHKATSINFRDLHSRQAYSPFHSYCQSKRAQVLWSAALGKRLHNRVTVLCVHPGVVDTSLYQHVWWAPLVSGLLFKAAEEGAAALVHAALSRQLEEAKGAYVENGQVKTVTEEQDAEEERLWADTWDMLRPWASPHLIDTAKTID